VRLFYAELMKIRTAPWTSVILVLALLGIMVLGSSGISSDARDGFVTDPEGDVVDLAGFATIFALIIGVLLVTWDYRHGTITQTFLAAPRRERVLGAKFGTAIVLSALLVVVALAVGLFVAKLWLGDQFSLSNEHWEQMGRIAAGAILWGILGLGLGATLQTQVGALITALVWFLVVEQILVGLGSRIWNIGHYLPGQALTKFASVSPPEHLTRAEAGLLAVAYSVGLALVGLVSVLRRDVG